MEINIPSMEAIILRICREFKLTEQEIQYVKEMTGLEQNGDKAQVSDEFDKLPLERHQIIIAALDLILKLSVKSCQAQLEQMQRILESKEG